MLHVVLNDFRGTFELKAGTFIDDAVRDVPALRAAGVSLVDIPVGQEEVAREAIARFQSTRDVLGDYIGENDVLGILISEGLISGGGGVDSFNSRTGAVVPATNDYDSDQVANNSTVAGASVTAALENLDASIPPAPQVDSVFGRTGAVAAQGSDYDASQVDNDSSVAGANVAEALDALLASSGGYTYTVGTAAQGANFTTIGAALADALINSPDAAIVLFPGTYVGNVTLPPNMSLTGLTGRSDNTVIQGDITIAGTTANAQHFIGNLRLEGDILLQGTAATVVWHQAFSMQGEINVTNTNGGTTTVLDGGSRIQNSGGGNVCFRATGGARLDSRDGQLLQASSAEASIITNGDIFAQNIRTEGRIEWSGGSFSVSGSACQFVAQGVPIQKTGGGGVAFIIGGNIANTAGGAPVSGFSGGDLFHGGIVTGLGTTPIPTSQGTLLDLQATGLRETSGPTILAVGAIADGQFVARSGTALIGTGAPAAPPRKLCLWAALPGDASSTIGEMQIAQGTGVIEQTSPGDPGINNGGSNPLYMPACTLVKAGLTYAMAAVQQGSTGGAMTARFDLYDVGFSARSLVTSLDFPVVNADVFNNLGSNQFSQGITLTGLSVAIPEGSLLGLQFTNRSANNNEINSIGGAFVYLEFDLT